MTNTPVTEKRARPDIDKLIFDIREEERCPFMDDLEDMAEYALELEAALKQYSDEANWVCPRCHKKDNLNCGMLHWTGPVGDDEHNAHGYTIAERALRGTKS